MNFIVGGTATSGSDYAPVGTTVRFAAGSSMAMVEVNPTADSTVEPHETVILTVLVGSGHTVGSPSEAHGTINNDDSAAVIVVGRHVFYNNSFFDGNSAAANSNDDNAIAPDKTALLPGGVATFANYTSYSRGINGGYRRTSHSARGTPTTLEVGSRLPLQVSRSQVLFRCGPAPAWMARIVRC